MCEINSSQDQWLLKVDFDQLMDLRVDYAFKLTFSKGDTLSFDYALTVLGAK